MKGSTPYWRTWAAIVAMGLATLRSSAADDPAACASSVAAAIECDTVLIDIEAEGQRSQIPRRIPPSDESLPAVEIPQTVPVELLGVIEPDGDQPLGFAGRVRARPSDLSGSDFVPTEDRWRLGFPQWDRYARGSVFDPYNQNVLKGDYPICGQDIFFQATAVSDSLFLTHKVPVAAGTDHQDQFKQNTLLTFDVFKNDNAFQPADWFVRFTPAFNVTDQTDAGTAQDFALQEAFVDVEIAEYDPFYDTTNLRIGRQGFVSDFRGFLFVDVNDAVRLFGNAEANRTQWNVIVVDPVKKDPVSQFNTFEDREQLVVIANLFREDFHFQGLNVEASVAYDRDRLKNDVDAIWLELAADGHIGRWQVSSAFIQALGRDDFNPIAKDDVTINAQLAALELAYPSDWIKPKFSVLFASGDADPRDGTGRGFDAIFDNPNFAGNGFSFLNREAITPGGVQLSNTFSFLPNLRTKANDPTNAVNPGLFLVNTGVDAVLSTRLFAQANVNYYQLVHPEPVELLAGVDVGRSIGIETNLGLVYKPLIIDNFIITLGASELWPGGAIGDLSGSREPLYTVFTAITLVY